eukprot:Platyproteum_vivax@DN14013_c0_g1_i1.p1
MGAAYSSEGIGEFAIDTKRKAKGCGVDQFCCCIHDPATDIDLVVHDQAYDDKQKQFVQPPVHAEVPPQPIHQPMRPESKVPMARSPPREEVRVYRERDQPSKVPIRIIEPQVKYVYVEPVYEEPKYYAPPPKQRSRPVVYEEEEPRVRTKKKNVKAPVIPHDIFPEDEDALQNGKLVKRTVVVSRTTVRQDDSDDDYEYEEETSGETIPQTIEDYFPQEQNNMAPSKVTYTTKYKTKHNK